MLEQRENKIVLCLIGAAMIIGGIAFEIGKVLAIFKYLFS